MMPRFFFDIDDGRTNQRDDTGILLPDLEAARKEAMSTLPAIAHDEIGKDGDRQTYTVLVTNEGGAPVFSATLSYAGLWLRR